MNSDPGEAPSSAVSVSLDALRESSISFKTLEEAFGESSLGILIVSGLPAKYKELRHKLLSYASYLAELPPEILDSLSLPEAKFLTGWSHGKEALKHGSYDTLKGSFYVNCNFYQSAAESSAVDETYSQYPELIASNVWPPERLLPGFRQIFEELCTLIIDSAALVARACDRYALAKINDYESGYLERVVRKSTTTKARLLHYFSAPVAPLPHDAANLQDPADTVEAVEENLDSWCATHIDHGCLTGLTSAMYIDESANSPAVKESTVNGEPTSLPPLPFLARPLDPSSGLYVRSRTGAITKVTIPADCLAFQTGETLQLITGGKFRAVPHFVRAAGKTDGRQIARNTLAVFTQPALGEVVDRKTGKTYAQFTREVADRFK